MPGAAARGGRPGACGGALGGLHCCAAARHAAACVACVACQQQALRRGAAFACALLRAANVTAGIARSLPPRQCAPTGICPSAPTMLHKLPPQPLLHRLGRGPARGVGAPPRRARPAARAAAPSPAARLHARHALRVVHAAAARGHAAAHEQQLAVVGERGVDGGLRGARAGGGADGSRGASGPCGVRLLATRGRLRSGLATAYAAQAPLAQRSHCQWLPPATHHAPSLPPLAPTCTRGSMPGPA